MKIRVKSKIGSVFALIFIAVALVVMFGISASTNYSQYLNERGQLDAIAGGVIVEAEIVEYASSDKNSDLVNLEYEYHDGDVHYYGNWKKVYRNEADEYVGQKIDIYIDGNGHSIAVGQDPPNAKSSLRLVIVYIVVCFAVIVIDVVLIVVFIRSCKKARRKKTEVAEKSEQPPTADKVDKKTAETESEKKDVQLDTEESVRARIEIIEQQEAAQKAVDNAGEKVRKFTLTVSDQIETEKIKSPKLSDLDYALSVLKEAHDHFIILDSAEPIDKFTFIQATDFEYGLCHVEAQYKVGRVSRSFGKDGVTEAELLMMLQDFYYGKAPDISDWKHVGDFRPRD